MENVLEHLIGLTQISGLKMFIAGVTHLAIFADYLFLSAIHLMSDKKT